MPRQQAPQPDADQDAARRFVKDILRTTGWTATRLAKEAGIYHTTISRFLNNENVTHTLSTRTISKIRAAASREIAPKLFDTLWLTPDPQAQPDCRKTMIRPAAVMARDAIGLVLCGACALLTVAWLWVLLP